MKSALYLFYILLSTLFLVLQVQACPTVRIWPRLAELMAMQELDSSPANPSARYFNLRQIFNQDYLTRDNLHRLGQTHVRHTRAIEDIATNDTRLHDILFNFARGTAEPSVGNSVRGNPSIIVGYHSGGVPRGSVGDILGIQRSDNGSASLLGAAQMGLFMALRNSQTTAAKERFGGLEQVLFDVSGTVIGLRFEKQGFIKHPGESFFRTEAPEMRIYSNYEYASHDN